MSSNRRRDLFDWVMDTRTGSAIVLPCMFAGLFLGTGIGWLLALPCVAIVRVLRFLVRRRIKNVDSELVA